MISPVRSLIITAFALSGLASSLSIPTDADAKRQDVEIAVGPVANAVSVDPVGVNMRTTVLNGAIIGGYSAVVNGEQIIRVTRSTNDGASWTQIGTVASGPADTRDIDNAFPLTLPNGHLLMAFRNHDQQPGNGEYTYYRITICESTDGGVSWTFVTHLVERARNGRNGFWEPYLRIARDGAIQAYYSAENADNDQDNLMKRSTDGGRTWSGDIPVSGSAVTARDGMVGVADVGGNTLMLVFESTQTGFMAVHSMLSSDDGLTWGSRAEVYNPTGNREAGAPQVANVGGTAVAIFMSNEAGTFSGVDGGELKVRTSTDRGASWSAAVVASGLGTHWPGIHVLNDNEFLLLYSFTGQGLVSRRFTK